LSRPRQRRGGIYLLYAPFNELAAERGGPSRASPFSFGDLDGAVQGTLLAIHQGRR
jgi:hypothetical protein